jgi:CheY-like chemotaxis protein
MLLDIGLPQMNGYDVCKAIRKEPWGKDLFIVAVIGWGQTGDREKSAEAGFNRQLVKPVDHGVLRKILGELSLEIP